jgi:hypothetical protein
LHGIAPQRRAGILGFIVGAYSVFVLVTPGGVAQHRATAPHRTFEISAAVLVYIVLIRGEAPIPAPRVGVVRGGGGFPGGFSY